MLAKWLSKWRDEDTAVRRNKVAPVLLVSGPTGSGKTSLVYAAAQELNIQILEVSPSDFSWQSNGKRQITEAVKEALQSRQVAKASLSSQNGSCGSSATSQIVLIDDVDVLIREDKSVLSSIASMTDDSKRPLVLTCTDPSIVTSPGILELSETFHVTAPLEICMSFLAFAYFYVLANPRGIRPVMTREECDSIGTYCRQDLRRVAIASELKYLETPDTLIDIYPTCIFPVRIRDIGNSDLIRILSSIDDGFPISCLDTENFDLCDLVMSTEGTLDEIKSRLANVCVANIRGMNKNVASQLVLGNRKWKIVEGVKFRHPNVHESLSYCRSIVNPFFSRATIGSLATSRYRYGDTMSALSVMARISNTSEFNSRRVRCVLDQCGYLPEIQILRDQHARGILGAAVPP
jgi:SpoVK/Ycf46/Vps4 family AAA+-type ATPase